MPQTKQITAYQFDELSDAAKEKARDWYRNMRNEHFDSSELESTVDDFAAIAEIMGVEFDTHEVNLMFGKSRRAPNIYWSVSHCQGDGACFEGTYDYKATAPQAIRDYAPKDAELHRIADQLTVEQIRWGFGLRATLKQTDSHYTHEHTISIDVEDRRDEDRDVSDAEKAISELLRDLMRWLHAALHAEEDYRNSDEAVDESIEANEYLFDEEGSFDGRF